MSKQFPNSRPALLMSVVVVALVGCASSDEASPALEEGVRKEAVADGSFPNEPRFIETNGIRMAVYEAGEGFPVVLAHGFPELAYSWRHQFPALVEAGFRVIAPDQRGYGLTDRPEDVALYSLDYLCRDLVGMLDALGIEKAVFVGHDWGGGVVWRMPLLFPDRVAGVVGVNTPFGRPPGPRPPLERMREFRGDDNYVVAFQEPGVADEILGSDVEKTFRLFMRDSRMSAGEFAALPPDAPERKFQLLKMLEAPLDPEAGVLISEEELAFYVDTFERTGFTGGINWYRNIDRNWEASKGLEFRVEQPSLYIGAADDTVLPPSSADGMEAFVPNLEKYTIEDCGHWTQQDKPEELNRILIDWLQRHFGREAATGFPPELSAGYKAGIVASGIFTAGRSLEDILRDELGGDPRAAGSGDPVIDEENKAVTVSYEGSDVPRLAVHLDGFGTVLMPIGATLEDRSMLPHINVPFQEGDPADIDWPDGDRLSQQPLPPEVNALLLDEAIEAAFSDDKYAPHKTLGVVVVYKDRIVAERYAPSWDMHTQYRSWSSAKSITSALVGILVGEGKLDVNAPAPIPEWQEPDHPNRGITLEHLLHMSSGLKTLGRGGGYLYWGGLDTGREAAASVPDVEPNTRWRYSNYDTLLIVRSMKAVIDDDVAFLTFPRRALLNKIGMRHTFPQIDPYGNFILSSQMYTTARDLARFGLLYLHDGVWNGERILPAGWVDYTVQKAPRRIQETPEDRGYGAQFWLMGDNPLVPADTYTTAGARGQLSTIVPSRDLVVARTGLDPSGSKWSQEQLVADVLQAIGSDT